MLDIGWSEFLVIGVAALIFVGPKDLPVMFRTLGRFTARARAMAREFQKAMDDAAKSTGVHETMQDVRDMTSKKSLGLTALENAAEKFEKWNPMKPEPRPSSPTPKLASAQPAAIPNERSVPPAEARPDPGPATRELAEKIARKREGRLEKQNGKDGGEGVALDAEPAAAPAPAKPRRLRAAKAVPATPNGADPVAAPKAAPKATKAAKAEPAPATEPKVRKPRTKKIDA